MTTTAENIFEQIQLSEASYANFANQSLTTKEALEASDFSASQAEYLVAHWQVIHHQSNTESDFSATLFESKDRPGEFTLAIRGTELSGDLPADIGDIVVDGLAIYQIVDLYNYWQRLNTPNDQHVMLAKLAPALAGTPESHLVFDAQPPGNAVALMVQFEQSPDFGLGKIPQGISSINIAGHSLGGHLAMAFTRLFPEVNPMAYTANAPGFGTQSSVDSLFNALAGKPTSFDSDAIINIYGGAGAEFVTQDGLLEQYGQRVEMFIESAEKGMFGHGVGQLTDSAAIFDLLIRMDPILRDGSIEEAARTMAEILGGVNASPDMSIESFLDRLTKLLLDDAAEIPQDNRQEIYSCIDNLRNVAAGKSYGIVSLAGQNASTLEALSYGDIAYRYALKELNPFAILGADYSGHNKNGELDLYDE